MADNNKKVNSGDGSETTYEYRGNGKVPTTRKDSLIHDAMKLGMPTHAEKLKNMEEVDPDVESEIREEAEYRKQQGDHIKRNYRQRVFDAMDADSKRRAQGIQSDPNRFYNEVYPDSASMATKPVDAWIGVRKDQNGNVIGNYNMRNSSKK